MTFLRQVALKSGTYAGSRKIKISNLSKSQNGFVFVFIYYTFFLQNEGTHNVPLKSNVHPSYTLCCIACVALRCVALPSCDLERSESGCKNNNHNESTKLCSLLVPEMLLDLLQQNCLLADSLQAQLLALRLKLLVRHLVHDLHTGLDVDLRLLRRRHLLLVLARRLRRRAAHLPLPLRRRLRSLLRRRLLRRLPLLLRRRRRRRRRRTRSLRLVGVVVEHRHVVGDGQALHRILVRRRARLLDRQRLRVLVVLLHRLRAARRPPRSSEHTRRTRDQRRERRRRARRRRLLLLRLRLHHHLLLRSTLRRRRHHVVVRAVRAQAEGRQRRQRRQRRRHSRLRRGRR
eukprot:Rhum_TRINITY_DN10660_c0_g1::Rhum_TRINITY_DN10660_c0_g1_i1::g.39520::m.39520